MRAMMAVLLCWLAVSCSPGDSSSVADAKPDRAGETRSFDVAGFNAVSHAGPDVVQVVQGTSFIVTARGPAKALDQLVLRVDDGTLQIGRQDKDARIPLSQFAVITVVLPRIREATLEGSGNMTVEGSADDRFSASLNGSGEFKIAGIRALQSEFAVIGSGNLTLTGGAQQSELNLSGSGHIKAAKFDVALLTIKVTGSGDVAALAISHADVTNSGSGNVTVKGTTDCKIINTGSGRARCG